MHRYTGSFATAMVIDIAADTGRVSVEYDEVSALPDAFPLPSCPDLP